MRRIVAAAVQIQGLTVSMPRPARHHNILHALHDMDRDDESRYEIEQGFIDNDGQFVDRETARAIAVAAGQLTARAREHRMLFSEDVW